MKTKTCLLLVALQTLIWTDPAVAENELSHALVGGSGAYMVKKGDFLTTIAGRFGESAASIAQENGIDYNAHIVPGQVLAIENTHIVPRTLENGILINVPQRLLFFFRNGEVVATYPVGLGRPNWPTPYGDFGVALLSKNPNWVVPINIQEEMRREGQVVRTQVPPGPNNPLGKYWIGLSRPGYGIHGTVSPSSIYQFRSHGCIRLRNEDIAELYPQIAVDDPVKIIYEPVLVATLDDGRIYLEVDPDVYIEGTDVVKTLLQTAIANHLSDRIDWVKAAQVIQKHEGLARQINLEEQIIKHGH